MWDAWAAYDETADGYIVTEKASADEPDEAREAAISFAVYRLLLWRYGTVSDLPVAAEQLDAVMGSLCYRTDYESMEGDSPAALGNRIGGAVIEYGGHDGALEEQRYIDSAYTPVNDPLLVTQPGTEMSDPNAWQPLALEEQVAQNGLPIPGKVQSFIGPHWGNVTAFALPPSEDVSDRSRSAAAPSAIRPPMWTSRRPPSPCCATAAISMPPTASRSTPARASGRQHARDQRRRRLPREPGDRHPVRAQPRAAR